MSSQHNTRDTCTFCASIDFDLIGFGRWKPDLRNHRKQRIISDVIRNADQCVFCGRILDIYRRWMTSLYGSSTFEDPDDAQAVLDVTKSPAFKIDDREIYQVARLTVEILLKDTMPGDPFSGSGPTAYFQRCGPIDRSKLSPYDGRLRPLLADFSLLRAWKDICLNSKDHQASCRISEGDYGISLRLIDVQRKCVVEDCLNVSYVALTYVWGHGVQPCMTRKTEQAIKQPGYLCAANTLATIMDAIEVTTKLGERFLWVDSCCILQDLEEDKLRYVPEMYRIFELATLTIVAASGSCATAGLPGLRAGSRKCEQTPLIAMESHCSRFSILVITGKDRHTMALVHGMIADGPFKSVCSRDAALCSRKSKCIGSAARVCSQKTATSSHQALLGSQTVRVLKSSADCS